MISRIWLSSFIVCSGLISSSSQSSAQVPAPMPDPLSTPGATTTTSTGGGDCQCDVRMLKAAQMDAVGPEFKSHEFINDVKPPGFTGSPSDEWSGNDELYRVSRSHVSIERDRGHFSANTSQAFEIYNATSGTDPGFYANHVHPSSHVDGELEWKTDGPPGTDVGIQIRGNISASGTVSVQGAVAPVGVQLQFPFIPLLVFSGFHADVGATATINVIATHPLKKCVQTEAAQINKQVSVTGSVSTIKTIETSVSLTAGNETKTATKDYEESVRISGNVGLTENATLTDTAFDANGTLTEHLPVDTSTNYSVLKLPVTVIATSSGTGTADEAYSIGNASAQIHVTWSGDVRPCAMIDPYEEVDSPSMTSNFLNLFMPPPPTPPGGA